MAIVAGVDFGTLSVRVSLLDDTRGRIATESTSYPLHRRMDDPDYATQSHADHLSALQDAMRAVIGSSGISGNDIAALALDTTGLQRDSSRQGNAALSEYYLWCDHRAHQEAAEITALAHLRNLERSNGAAVCIRMNEAGQNCFTGCVTTRKNEGTSHPRLNSLTDKLGTLIRDIRV